MKAEELYLKFAEKVRGDSRYLADLTSANSLGSMQGELEEVEANLAHLANDTTTYSDIKSITGPTGKVYFFSEKYMTPGYAKILARVKAEDPCLTIVETVRDESRIYPRATNIELFKYGLFKIDRDQLDTYVARVQELHDDIKQIVTPKGAVCLYSTKYLTEDWAAFLAKKQETPDS